MEFRVPLVNFVGLSQAASHFQCVLGGIYDVLGLGNVMLGLASNVTERWRYKPFV